MGIVPEGEDWKTSVGPAKYEVKNGNFGTIPPRHKIGLPRREFVDTGPPRIPVKPVDTLGMLLFTYSSSLALGPVYKTSFYPYKFSYG